MTGTLDSARRERWLAAGGLALGLNSAYLAARSDPRSFTSATSCCTRSSASRSRPGWHRSSGGTFRSSVRS
jgi:hypothetical protein